MCRVCQSMQSSATPELRERQGLSEKLGSSSKQSTWQWSVEPSHPVPAIGRWNCQKFSATLSTGCWSRKAIDDGLNLITPREWINEHPFPCLVVAPVRRIRGPRASLCGDSTFCDKLKALLSSVARAQAGAKTKRARLLGPGPEREMRRSVIRLSGRIARCDIPCARPA